MSSTPAAMPPLLTLLLRTKPQRRLYYSFVPCYDLLTRQYIIYRHGTTADAQMGQTINPLLTSAFPVVM